MSANPAPFIVALYDLSAYPENTVLVVGAPLETAFAFESYNEAWDAVLEFGDEFQVSLMPVEAAPACVLAAL